MYLSCKGSEDIYFQRLFLGESQRKSFLLGFNCGNFLSYWKGCSWSGSDELLGSDGSDALRVQSVLYIE